MIDTGLMALKDHRKDRDLFLLGRLGPGLFSPALVSPLLKSPILLATGDRREVKEKAGSWCFFLL